MLSEAAHKILLTELGNHHKLGGVVVRPILLATLIFSLEKVKRKKGRGSDHACQNPRAAVNDQASEAGAGSSGSPGHSTTFVSNSNFWANVNDVAHIQNVLDKRNFDSDFSLFTATNKVGLLKANTISFC